MIHYLKKLVKNFIFKKQILKFYDYFLNLIYRIKVKGIYDKKDNAIIEEHKKNIFLKSNQISQRIPIKNQFFIISKNIDSSNIYKIKINKFVGIEANHFLSGSDPLVETARQILEEPNIKFYNTFLYEYFKNFRPKSLGEFYNLKLSNKLHSVKSTKEFHPWLNEYPRGFTPGFFGPKDDSSIKFRVIRLKNLVKNIKKYGYMPSNKDIIEGYILKNKKDYRFVVIAGHHRVSVMSIMHILDKSLFKYLPVKFKAFPPSKLITFNEEEILKWPAIKSNFLSVEDSLEMFNKFF